MKTVFAYASSTSRIAAASAQPLGLPQRASGQLTACLEDIFAGPTPPWIAGVVPFDPIRNPPALWRIEPTTRWTPSMPLERPVLLAGPGHCTPSASAYLRAVDEALARFARTTLRKVVLARCVELPLQAAPHPMHVFRTLQDRNPTAYCYAAEVAPDPTDCDLGRRTLVGASPELLLRKVGAAIESNPLAGSLPRSADPHEDRRRAAELLESAKDLREHAYVVRNVTEVFAQYCREMHVPERPGLIATETMWHLSTRISGVLADPTVPSTTLALALHPTPAVCGSPTILARDTITELEAFDRRYFSGVVGWMAPNGDGEWAVAIRCAEIGTTSIRLYAGAGVVVGSQPEREWLETGAKLETIRRALGLTEGRGDAASVVEAAE